MTIREMCETIVESKLLGSKTWEEVYEYSNTGELCMIWEWHSMAEAILLNGYIEMIDAFNKWRARDNADQKPKVISTEDN